MAKPRIPQRALLSFESFVRFVAVWFSRVAISIHFSTGISFQNASVDDLGPEPTKIQRGKETLRNCSSFWLT